MNSSIQQDSGRYDPLAFFTGNLALGAAAHGIGIGRILLALAMIALGIRGFVFGEFAGVWQRIPLEHLPAHDLFVYLTAFVELATGIGILIPRIAKVSAAAMSVFVLLWMVLLKIPVIVHRPLLEVSWLGAGEIAVILAGAWILFAALANPGGRFFAGRNAVMWARLLFVLGLPAIGLSHFFYAKATAGFIPAWLPWHYFWAFLTGAGNIAAALGILFGVWPRLAATLEAAMLSVITLVVWLPGLIAAPSNASWTPFLMSTIIAAGAWVVAGSYRRLRWLTVGASWWT